MSKAEEQSFGLISGAFGFMSRIVGEAVHQLDNVYEGTKAAAESIYEDIKKIPDACEKGYTEELFPISKEPEVTETVTVQEVVHNEEVKTILASDAEQNELAKTFPHVN